MAYVKSFKKMYNKQLIEECKGLIAQYKDNTKSFAAELQKRVISLNKGNPKFQHSDMQEIRLDSDAGVDTYEKVIGLMELANKVEENTSVQAIYAENNTDRNKYSKGKPYGGYGDFLK